MKINDLNKIIYFKEAAESLSYTKAADKLRTTTSTVQRSVALLEESLRTKLFIRKYRGLALTPEGKMFLDRVLKSMKELYLGEKELAERRQEPTNKLRILTTLGLAADWVYKCIPIIKELHPTLKIELATSNVELSLESEEYDIYIGPKIETAPNYKNQFLVNLDFKLYASQKYLEQYGYPKVIQDLKNHKLINFSGSVQAYFIDTNELFDEFKNTENYDLMVDYYLVERLLVEANLGIASISKDIVKLYYPHFIDIFPNRKPVTVSIYMYHLSKNLEARIILKIYDALMKTSLCQY